MQETQGQERMAKKLLAHAARLGVKIIQVRTLQQLSALVPSKEVYEVYLNVYMLPDMLRTEHWVHAIIAPVRRVVHCY